MTSLEVAFIVNVRWLLLSASYIIMNYSGGLSHQDTEKFPGGPQSDDPSL